jgi:hypothetical protein
MSTRPLPWIKNRWLDANCNPLAGGKLYSYVAGTSTPAATYTDYDGLTPNSNPVELDANGEANVWIGSGIYKFILTDADDVQQWSIDNVSADTTATTSPWTEHAITDGQAATALTGETVNFASYSSALYEVEIIRGTTVIANGHLAVQNLNGTGRVKTGMFMTDIAHGVTFDVSQAGQVATLRAACSTGPGSGTVKLRRHLIAI